MLFILALVCVTCLFFYLLKEFSPLSNLQTSLIIICSWIYLFASLTFVGETTCGRFTGINQDKLLFSTGKDACSVEAILEGSISCHFRNHYNLKKVPESCSLSKAEAIEEIKKGRVEYNNKFHPQGIQFESILDFCCNENVSQENNSKKSKPRDTKIINYDYNSSFWSSLSSFSWGSPYRIRYSIDCSELCS